MARKVTYGIYGHAITRDGDGSLPAYAWPGGYQICYYTDGGDQLCPACANEADRDSDEQDPPVCGDTYDEGPAIQCANCQGWIFSSYGDPDDEEMGDAAQDAFREAMYAEGKNWEAVAAAPVALDA